VTPGFEGPRSDDRLPMNRDAHPLSEPCGLNFADLARLTDEQVMAHVQAGHDDALAILFDRYHRLVVSIAYKILRDLGEAEDVTQLVFLEIFKVAAQFDPSRGSTKTWLLQYAYHRSMNRRKYLKFRNFYDSKESGTGEPGTAEGGQQQGLGGQLVLQELRSLIREGLETLNTPQRRTLQMAYFEGMSLKEIADRTGESLGNVRHHYYRGLRRMRSFVSKGSSHGKAKQSREIIRRGTVDVEA
jgi:RNA polymerase sigma-70 factor, ECF subfamily